MSRFKEGQRLTVRQEGGASKRKYTVHYIVQADGTPRWTGGVKPTPETTKYVEERCRALGCGDQGTENSDV